MKIEINTKYAIGDELYGFDGDLRRFRVNDIVIPCGCAKYGNWKIAYECTCITDSEFTYSARFAENELYTADELADMLDMVLKKKQAV